MATPPEAHLSSQTDTSPAPPSGGAGPELGYPLVERRRGGGTGTWDGVERRSSPGLRAPAPALPPAISPFRWAALAVGFVIGWEDLSRPDGWSIAAGLALVAVTVWRTLQPLPLEGKNAYRWLTLAKLPAK